MGGLGCWFGYKGLARIIPRRRLAAQNGDAFNLGVDLQPLFQTERIKRLARDPRQQGCACCVQPDDAEINALRPLWETAEASFTKVLGEVAETLAHLQNFKGHCHVTE